jgi:hypothetical protein
MKITVNLDDDLVEKVTELTGIDDKTLLICTSLKLLIEHESSKRLARFGGSEPALQEIRRR